MTTRRRTGGDPQGRALLLFTVVAFVAVLAVTGVAWLARWLSGGTEVWPTNPFALVFGLVSGRYAWPGSVLPAAAVVAVPVLLIAVVVGVVAARRARRRSRVDYAAPYLATGQDLRALLNAKGARVGRLVPGGGWLRRPREWVSVQLWGPRQGKALPVDTPVLTPHGWVPIKEMARGCRVIGADGRPTTVTGVYPQGIRPAWRVRFSDGTSIVCDPDHLWSVRPKIRNDKKRPVAWRTWTTRQLAENGLQRREGGARYFLPVVAPVQFEGPLPEGRPVEPVPPAGKGPNVGYRSDRRRRAPAEMGNLPVDPYLLGVLLGDGGLTGGSVRLTTSEPEEMLARLAPLLPPQVVPKHQGEMNWALTVGRGYRNPLIDALRELGVMGHSSLTKFIPEAYLLADVPARQALLAGLLDTDGSITEAGQIEYSSSSPRLSDDVRFLVQSLGGTVTTARRETPCAPSYRSHMRLPADGPVPFRLARKAQRWEAVPRRQPTRGIVAIEPEGEADMVCISVAAPDGLFVTEHCIVTHNTATQVVESVLTAPGTVLATSNKRDAVDATREARVGRGMVWILDPNGIAGERPAWWWNPLSYVTDETKARQLARVFTNAQREPGARTDSYFDPAGQSLLGNLLLAAAAAGLPVTAVYGWLTHPTVRTPVEKLREHGYPMQADAVESVIDLNPKQRGGVYGTAEQTMSFLGSAAVREWVTPPGGAFSVEFDPAEFVRSTGDSLYLLSKEGEGSGGPIVTALTVAVVEAAVAYANTCHGGHLPTPMTVELDEAANICRWLALPDLYSHFGSQWIEVATYLQSWSQGVGVWGQEGMRKLWSAANLKVVGPGVGEVSFLGDVSQLAGDYDPTRVSTGYGQSGRSVNYTPDRQRILPVSALGALPGPGEGGDFSRARVLVLSAGSPPALARPVPWWEGDHAAAVRASLALHDPGQAPVRPVPAVVPQEVPPAGERWRRR